MQDMQTVIVLLSIIVTILSVMVIALLGVMIALLIKTRRIIQRVDDVTANIAKATEWLSPTKMFGEIMRLFGKK